MERAGTPVGIAALKPVCQPYLLAKCILNNCILMRAWPTEKGVPDDLVLISVA